MKPKEPTEWLSLLLNDDGETYDFRLAVNIVCILLYFCV